MNARRQRLFPPLPVVVRGTLTTTATTLGALLGSHAAVAVVCDLLEVTAPPGALAVTLAAVAGGLVLAWGFGRRLQAAIPESWTDFGPRRGLVALLVIGCLLTVVQYGRLATHVADPEQPFVLSTADPFWTQHECLPAYVHAAELAARGEPNVWDATHYPGIHPEAEPHTDVAGMAVEDPYQYTPQFLLLPAAALALTDQYPTIRTVWFAGQVTAFFGLAILVLAWLPPRARRLGLVALPFVLTSFGTLYDFQYGQVHLLAIGLAVAAMLAFGRSRHGVGGALLGFAILAKLFPAVLLIPLAVTGRWRAIGATVAAMAAATLATLLVFGIAPFEAFVSYHLPRLRSGEAVAFWEAWPDVATVLIASNQGAYGMVLKLGALGVPGMTSGTASVVSTGYLLGVAGLAALGATWAARARREARVAFWLGLLGLASLGSPAAFGDYVPSAAMWLLALRAHRVAALPRAAQVALGAAALALYTVLGTAPIGSYFGTPVLVVSVATAGVLAGVFAWPVLEAAGGAWRDLPMRSGSPDRRRATARPSCS